MAKAKKSGKKGLTLTEEILRYRLMPIREFESMTVEAAKLLALEGGHKHADWDDCDAIEGFVDDASSMAWIKALSDEAARELCKSGKWYDLDLSGLGSISDSVAEILSKLKGDQCSNLGLNGLTSITDKTAASLGKFSGKDELSLNGITSLSDKAASALSKYKGERLSLKSLDSLSPKAAEALGKYKGRLRLEGLTELSDQAAAGLASHKGELVLSSIKSVSDAAAEALAGHQDIVDLSGLDSISDKAALSFSKNKSIEVSGQITKKIEKSVKKHATASSSMTPKDQSKIRELIKTKDPDNVDFACNLLNSLDASEGDWLKLFPKTKIHGLLATLDTKIWNTLATAMKPHDRVYEQLKVEAENRLNSNSNDWAVHNRIREFQCRLVKVANDGAIDLLVFAMGEGQLICWYVEVQMKGTILKSGKIQLLGPSSVPTGSFAPEPNDIIIELISNHVGDISLNVYNLTDKLVEALCEVEGSLYFHKLTKLSDAAVESLSKYKGDLQLNGLIKLRDAAVESLSKHKGDLSLAGLIEISDAAAESLSKHKGVLNLSGLTKLSDAAAASLSKVKGDLSFYSLTKLSDAAAAALAQKKGTINGENPQEFVDGLKGK